MFSRSQQDELERVGYLRLPSYFAKEHCQRMVGRLQFLRAERPNTKFLLPDPLFFELLMSDAVLSIPASLFESTYLFHHANGRILEAGGPGKPWHHDYDDFSPWRPGKPRMIHIMVFPAGLDDAVSPLVIRPGSHLKTVLRHIPNKQGFKITQEDVQVRGDPGLVVVLNSALWHMRPPNPGPKERYDLNFSFCERRGHWPERSEYTSTLSRLRANAGEKSSLFST